MYTRAYDENLGIVIPESYGGTALRDDGYSENNEFLSEESNDKTANQKAGIPPDKTAQTAKSEPTGSFFSKLSFKNFLGNFFDNGKFNLQKIGTEEILIIATAAFLFFSKDGDKECALMLLLLLVLT